MRDLYLEPRWFGQISDEVRGVAFSPDGKTLAVGHIGILGSEAENIVRLWDVATGEMVAELRGHTGGVINVTFSPDGKRLATEGGGMVSDDTVRLWDLATGRALVVSQQHGIGYRSVVAFSVDGKMLAAGGKEDNNLRLWDTATGEVITRGWRWFGLY
jgi:WD40 repeat protein